MRVKPDDILGIVQSHESWRGDCLNLIASENILSQAVRASLDNDLVQRYGDYVGRDLTNRKYRGNRHLQKVEDMVADLTGEVFHATQVELRAISGHVAGIAVIAALAKAGDVVLELGRDGGGHRLASKLAAAPLVDLDVRFLPFDPDRFNVDVPRAIDLIHQTEPSLVILGSSTFLFPHPVAEIAEALADHEDCVLAYDGSHVLGLIAGHQFQDPLREGADVLFGSTHKTLAGPQGGVILSNDEAVMARISDALYPPIVTNHHPFRIPALGLCLLEMQEYGDAYARQVVRNAQQLGQEIRSRGMPVVGFDDEVTTSHTLLVKVDQYGTSSEVAGRLEQANIITSPSSLHPKLGSGGVRIGTQEITRLGMGEAQMTSVADLIVAAICQDEPLSNLQRKVVDLRADYQIPHYTWSSP